MSKIVTVIQARCGSTRLPGKVLLPICGKPLLLRMVQRVQASKLAGTVVVATTQEAKDDPIEDLCKAYDLAFFRGHSTDLLDRHYQVGKSFKADVVLKIPSDCPLIDPKIIDKTIQFFLDHQGEYDFVSNLHPATYPDGNDVEIMTMEALEQAWKEAEKPLEREHTTPYFWENPSLFRLANVPWETGLNYAMSHRWTIDYPEDYDFINKVYAELFPINPTFALENILDLLESHPEIHALNSRYAGVNWYRNHLDELKTVKPEETRTL